MIKIDLINKLRSSFEFSIWKELFDVIFSPSCVQYFSQEVPVDTAFIKGGGHIGTIRLDDGRSLAIFIFEVADNIDISRNRKGLRDIAAKYVDQSLIHGALVLYYSNNQTDYRLTFTAKQSSFNESGQLIKTETAPKRYTFLLGPNEPCTTAANRLYELFECKRKNGSIYLADVTEAFSVERLNKEFFDGYKKQYQKFLCNLSDTKPNRDYVKKLLGRIVFLHFLQKKGWMGVPASNSNWIGGDRNYLANLVAKYNGNNRLLSDVLELLFFNTLNQPRPNDLVDPILGNDIKIPYLNGGLFDKDPIDELDIDFPYDYFKDLMEFFSQYNFTIDENDPDYSEVGIDPEMLGHIFENLLEDNKDKGAFYTPKEIVQYMSRECIIQYLIAHTKEDLFIGHLKEAIIDLVNKQVVSIDLQDKANAQRLYSLLVEVKVCDPAIGSGAFPMGVLNVLFHTRHVLHAFAFPKKDFVSYEVKREIIQNNIYGVDIEQGAVDIARLRFWLSLVVDAEKPHPLPNLDYKIVCGNSLLNRHALDVPIDEVFAYYSRKNKTDFTLTDYQQQVLQYTNTSDHKLKDNFRKTISDIKNAFKTSLTNRILSKRNRIQGQILSLESDTLFGPPTKECLKQAKELRKKYARLLALNSDIENDKLYADAFEWRFEFPSLLDIDGNFKGFDIVIGNPPYNELRNLEPQMQEALKDTEYYKFAKGGRLNMYQFFYPLAIKIAANGGIISLITQNSVLAEDSALGNRKLFFSETDILSINSFPERDNRNLRVFESVKMSVCICTLQKTSNPNGLLKFNVNVWKSRRMIDKHVLTISKEDILDIYPDDLIIPISDNDRFLIIKDLSNIKQYQITASAGEIDMTKFKSHFNMQNVGTRVITGAQIQRYHITDNPSQGMVPYLSDISLSQKRLYDIKNTRIVLQRITGVDSYRRIVATIIKDGYFCANSTNYISIDPQSINPLYLLGILNSTLINFYIKQTSTNTNITAKVLESLPIIHNNMNAERVIATLVEYILTLKSSTDISTIVSNNTISNYFDKIIDGIVFELYFQEHMKRNQIDVLEYALELIPLHSLLKDLSISEQNNLIWSTYTNIKKTNNCLRERLELFSMRSPNILKHIIQE